jgi:multidrug efflux pump subunit AcrA (membrane-fusion protein)
MLSQYHYCANLDKLANKCHNAAPMIYTKTKLKFNSLTLRGKTLAVAGAVFILAVLIIFTRSLFAADIATTTEKPASTVAVLPAAELSKTTSSLTVTGTIRSKNESDLRVDVPGRVTGIFASIGTWVTRDTLIAEVENSAQKAQLTQALGALQSARAQKQSAEAQLEKAVNGSTQTDKNIVASQVASAETTLASAYDAARNALHSAYATTNTAVQFGTDTMMNDSTTVNPTLAFSTTEYSAKISSENKRVFAGDIVSRHKAQAGTVIATEQILAELSKTTDELISLKELTDDLLIALGGAITTAAVPQTTITTHITTMSTARTQVIASISALTTVKNTIATSQKALVTTQSNETKVLTETRSEDIAVAQAQLESAQASVTSALGAYQGALSALEKTRVRAPISGTLASFSARKGDFIDTKTLGRIVGTGGTEITFYIPSTDNTRVALGDTIRILDTIEGTVVSISNSTDSLSRQLEVRADLTTNPNLPNGSIVTVQLVESVEDTDIVTNTPAKILVPINAIKFGVVTASMFTVETIGAEQRLVAIPVTLGAVLGSMVEVTGVSPETLIVTDARGLVAGQAVSLSVTTNAN